ncbi:MAG: helicase-exonuclease AddAB subunit AddA [Clostridiales bacterium]|nr:helicase-exonuclease AddAB subunit AddA [Candidatus Cacconaster stercorequi]
MAIELTNDQRTAVFDRGGALLVSAAAGSGKTKVLVERLFAYMEQEHCHVDDFLIITYTKAAAAELRSKIAAELSRRVAEHPEDSHLRRQMFRVYQADIKTVDAFCASLLRENVHLLPAMDNHSLTPDFRVLDEHEAELLRRRVLTRVLEEFYQHLEQEDAEALLLAETLGAGRDDRALEMLVLEGHNKIQSHPYPMDYLAQVRESWENLPDDLLNSSYGKVIVDDTRRKAAFWRERLTRAAEQMADCPAVYNAYADRFLETAEQLRAYEWADSWDAMGEITPVFRRMGSVRGEENAAYKEQAQVLLKQCKTELKKMSAIYQVSQEEYLADLEEMAPAMLALIRLIGDFSDAYQREKVRRNVMDFSDQEHYAIGILRDDQGHPTELAQQVASRYREIMVDEYQDTNAVQNCIFSAVSKQEQNLFAVGDVKQSIYRFRLADPTIFLEKYTEYADAPQPDGTPRRVLLSQNFRSRQSVLSATNFVFRHMMSREMGEMEYGEEEALHFGASYYLPRTDTDTEFHLVSVENTEEEQFDRTEVEARFVAHRIRELLDEKYPVQGADGQLRAMEPEDIVILMRSPRARLNAFTHALEQENIPCSSGESENFFATMEIAVMFSFLQIIDNPRQDVPLISVLRSPLFGFTPDRLAEIRALSATGDFYDALCLDEREDAAAFRDTLDELRDAAREMPADRLLWHIYNTCHVLGIFGAMDGGQQRRNNLIALCNYAGTQPSSGRVFDFVTQLRRMLERDKQPAIAARQSGGGVRIMSIHSSKGLEFPVVILADLQKNFNTDDFKRPVLVHPKLGFGTECVDRKRHIRYDTVSKMAAELLLRRENMAEEMRILYVAMTRAKEKLILVDCMKFARTHLRNLISIADIPMPPEAVNSAKCMGDWLLLPLLCTQEGEVLRRWAEMDSGVRVSTEGGWQVSLWENPVRGEIRKAEVPAEDAGEDAAFDPSVLERVYAHQRACGIPTKITATQLKGREADREIAEGAIPHRREISFEKPKFLTGRTGLSAAERGTAMHLVMEHLNFDSDAPAAEQVQAMTERRLLTPEQAAAVDCAAIEKLLSSPLMERIRRSCKVYREYRFALLVPASLYEGGVEDEEMMLQGVVDCAFETDGGLVIVDFKTDHIRPGQEAERAEHYRPQLDAYARALSQVLEMPVKEKILYFFATETEILLK